MLKIIFASFIITQTIQPLAHAQYGSRGGSDGFPNSTQLQWALLSPNSETSREIIDRVKASCCVEMDTKCSDELERIIRPYCGI